PGPRREPCCDWSGPPEANGTRALPSNAAPLQRALVDLDAQPRSAGQVQEIAAKLALRRGDRVGEQELGGEPMGQPGGCALARQDLGAVSGRRDPDRPVEGAGEVDRQPRGDLQCGPKAADLGELDRGELAGAELDGAPGVIGARDAL